MISKVRYCFYILIFIFFSCEKDIDLTKDIPPYQEKLVIEGCIESGKYPWVYLSKNHDYLSEIDFAAFLGENEFSDLDISKIQPGIKSDDFPNIDLPALLELLEKFIVWDAKITVSDGHTIDTLKLTIHPDILEGKYAYPPIKYEGKNLKGESGKRYYLTVHHYNNIYTAETSITQPIYFDSIWFETFRNEPSFGFLKTIVKDDPSETNYYRIFTKNLGRDNDYVPSMGSLQNDRYFNGKEFLWTIYGNMNFTEEEISEDKYDQGMFQIGDTILTKFCTMDQSYFMFWESLSSSNGGFFSEPSKVKSNIEGGALGVWGGYGVAEYTVICEVGKNLVKP